MFHESKTAETCVCAVSWETSEPRDDNRSPAPISNATPQPPTTKLVRVSMRQGESWRAAAFFLVPLHFDENQIEAAATPITEALGQHEFEITGSVETLLCDLHVVARPDRREDEDADPVQAAIDRCITAALEKGVRAKPAL